MEPKKFGGGGARARRQKRYGEPMVRFYDRGELTCIFQLPLSGCVLYFLFNSIFHRVVKICSMTMHMH
jgi:hypothetical protein